MRAAIMQPTYLPWTGYFGMIDLTDIFVFFDDVQFEKQSWQQRNKIRSRSSDWKWLTVPVIHNNRQNIKDVEISNAINWRQNHWLSIYHSYGTSPFFKNYFEEIKNIYDIDWKYINDLNIFTIKLLSRLLTINIPKFIKSSELSDITGRKTDRVCQILEQIDADGLIVGPGSKEYLEVKKLKERGINVYWYNFQHPEYPQNKGNFVDYLSALDLLFNIGGGSITYIREGIKDSLKLDDNYKE
jgi:hypothetical protein